MPGKRITDHQVHKYKKDRSNLTQVAAAARAGLSERSARRVEQSQSLPSQRQPRTWRTRADPLGDVWEAEVVPLLQADAGLNAVTLLEELQRRHPGNYDEGVLRTLQRRMRQWRAVHGAEREMYFAQEHPPGRLGLSDFTVCDELAVEIGGISFPHRLYQFALAHSGWRHATIVTTGESFMALSSGLQSALWRLGGVPEEHRTDSLSAAFNNLAEEQEIDYRHLVSALKRKPGAFARWVLRDAAFPRAVYRHAWERLAAALPEREACKTIVGLLSLAADGHEAQLADELEQLIELGQLPDLQALSELLVPPPTTLPDVTVQLVALSTYDALIEVAQ